MTFPLSLYLFLCFFNGGFQRCDCRCLVHRGGRERGGYLRQLPFRLSALRVEVEPSLPVEGGEPEDVPHVVVVGDEAGGLAVQLSVARRDAHVGLVAAAETLNGVMQIFLVLL